MGSRSRTSVVVVAAVLALGIVAPAATPARAATIRQVPATYPTIQAAIDAASTGDTVLVAPGTYPENLLITKALTIESSAGAETTVVDAGGTGFVANISAAATLRGFTIQHGGGSGGGIVVSADGAVIESNRIVDNLACGEGAGIDAVFSSVTIEDNYIARNHSSCTGGIGGGGIALRGAGATTVRGNVIEDNGMASASGGGITVAGNDATIDANTFTGNTGTQGGGLFLGPVAAQVTNNLFVGNTADQGGGIAWQISLGGQTPMIQNNTFVDNAAPTGSAVYADGFDSSVNFRMNIVSGATAAALITCTQTYDGAAPTIQASNVRNTAGPGFEGSCGGAGDGFGNTSMDPKFVDRARGDYHLRPDSPLIDAGQNPSAPTVDIDGDARPHDGDEDGTAITDPGFDEAVDPLLVDPAYLYMGNVDVGATGLGTVTLTNLGASSMSVTSAVIGGTDAAEFTIAVPQDDTCSGKTLAVHASCHVKVSLVPTVIATRHATLTISGPGAVGTRVIPLEGVGIDPILVLGGPMAFGEVVRGTSSIARQAEVDNYGPSVSITGVSVGGSAASDFAIGSDTCTGQAIPTGGKCTFGVTFTPTAAGPRTATVSITGPGIVGTRTIDVSGTGMPPPSGVSWGTTYAASASYAWNSGYGLARTVQGTTQRLHGLYATDRVSGTWAKDTGPYAGVYYTRATSGASWSTGRRLNPTNQHAVRLGIAAYGSRVYATWVSQTRIVKYSSTAPRVLYVRVNTNHGDSASWKSTIRLTSTTGRIDYPTIAASGYDVHVAWTDAVTGSVKVATSRDRGVTWKTRTVGSTTAGTTSNKEGDPSVAVAGATVAVTWIAANTGTVMARVSTDHGTTWGTPVTLASTSWGYVTSAVRGSRVGVTWTGDQGVVLAMRTSGTWAAPVVVAPDDGVHLRYAPAIALQDPNRVGIAWAEEADTPTWSTLRWAESPDGGASWYQAQDLGTTTASGARRANDWPSIAWPTSSTRYVTWNGWTDSTNYYRLYLRTGSGTPVAITTAATPFEDGASGRAPTSAGQPRPDKVANARR